MSAGGPYDDDATVGATVDATRPGGPCYSWRALPPAVELVFEGGMIAETAAMKAAEQAAEATTTLDGMLDEMIPWIRSDCEAGRI